MFDFILAPDGVLLSTSVKSGFLEVSCYLTDEFLDVFFYSIQVICIFFALITIYYLVIKVIRLYSKDTGGSKSGSGNTGGSKNNKDENNDPDTNNNRRRRRIPVEMTEWEEEF